MKPERERVEWVWRSRQHGCPPLLLGQPRLRIFSGWSGVVCMCRCSALVRDCRLEVGPDIFYTSHLDASRILCDTLWYFAMIAKQCCPVLCDTLRCLTMIAKRCTVRSVAILCATNATLLRQFSGWCGFACMCCGWDGLAGSFQPTPRSLEALQ